MGTIAELKTLLSHREPAQNVVVDVNPTTVWTAPASELQTALGVIYVPPETVSFQATVTGWLNVRSGPGIDNPIIGKYAPGMVVDVLSDAPQTVGLYTWWKISGMLGTSHIVGWAANKWLQRVQPPPVAHKLGLHSLLDGRSKVQAFIASGARLASITVIGDAGYANLMAQSVQYVIFRDSPDLPVSIPDDENAAEGSGDAYANALFAKLDATGDLDLQDSLYIQGPNEVKWGPGHNGFWIGYMRNLTARGRRAAICAYAVGQPEPNQWQTMAPALEYAKAHNHIVVLHCYCAAGTPIGQLSADGPDFELRFVRLYNSVPESARPTLVISEFAHEFTRGKFEGTDALITTAKLYRDAIAPYLYVGGFNLYTVGKLGGWDTSCIDSALTDSGVLALFK